jgi:uncharacterized membrane protein (UPF0182 family)
VAVAWRRGRRRWFVVTTAALVAVLVVLSVLSGFYVDLLWFREVGFPQVFWRVFWTRALLAFAFGLAFFVLLYGNLLLVRRLRPRFVPFSPEQEAIERYRAALEPYIGRILPTFSAVVALFVGLGASGQWETFLLWRFRGPVSFGVADPLFGRDVGFYVFTLPFQKFVQGWLFSALVGVTVVTTVAHYLAGGIRLQAPGEKVLPQVKAHLSVLFGLIFVVKAWGYFLGRFDLLTSPRGVVTGASYTDVHAQLPALNVLAVIALVCSVLFFANIRLRGWVFPVLGVGLLALASIVIGAIVPAVVQRFRVAPQELQQERPYIERNIAFTRQAYGLDRVRLVTTSVSREVRAEAVEENEPTIQSVRLWDPEIIRLAYENLQRIQPYYEFPDVDVDRYEIDGQRRVVMVSVREVAQAGIPGGQATWQNRHLVYTHGYGAVASPVNTATPEGLPAFTLRDIPPPSNAGIRLDPGTGAQVYFGELSQVPFVVVRSGVRELNYPRTGSQEVVETTYQGRAGIELGDAFRRLLFAYRFRDVNLLISDLVTEGSRILINRDIRTRVTKVAPFLRYDGDPYAAIVDGRIVYIWDAYTTTDAYPYSQRVSLTLATGGALTGRVNYIRNPVKVVMDAYHGTLTFYVVDPTDPLIRVWMRAFPGLFTTDPPPASLREHFRYPENLLQVQAFLFARYHMTNPQAFYFNSNLWAVPQDPADEEGRRLLRPYYVLTKLPGEQSEQFVLFMPFTPYNRPNMTAYLAAKSDPDEYGELVAFEFPSGAPPDGPQQVFNRINADDQFAQERTLLGQTGSRVLFGNLFVVPIEDSFLYVQPVFVLAQQATAIPELKRVVVVNGDTVVVGATLAEALARAVGQRPPERPPPEEEAPRGVQELLARAVEHFDRADALLRQGDLAGYQREIEAGRALVERARELAGGQGPAPTPSPSPTG